MAIKETVFIMFLITLLVAMDGKEPDEVRVLRKKSFLASVNDGGDENGIRGRMEEKINEITKLVKEKKFKKKRKQVLKLLNDLSAMVKECKAPPTAPPKPGPPTTPPKPVPDSSNFQLSYPSKTVEDYVSYQLSSSAADLTAFTLCLWMNVSDPSDDGTVFSYSLPDQDNELLLTDYSWFKILIGSHKVKTDEAANDGQWHHICTTWENSAGSWNFYIDGELKNSGTDFQTYHAIKSGGIVILGQDQDDYGDAFDQHQSFFGEMYGVNLWSRVLSADEILSMSGSCFHEGGDYLKWSDFKEAQLHGDVSIISPTTCSP